MALSNPAFNTPAFSQSVAVRTAPQPGGLSAQQLDELYTRPAAGPTETDRMSYDDVIVKTLVALVFLLAGGAVGAIFPALMLPALFVGLGLALVNIFKKVPSAPLVLAYAAVEGVFVGGLSFVLENIFEGIVFQAVIGTVVVFAVTLALFANGKVRASKRATKIFIIAGVAYGIFSLVNLTLQLTGINQDPWGLASQEVFGIPLGLIIGPLAILMAAYSLVLDFDSVKNGVAQGVARIFGWKAAFGLVLTIVWLYVEFLRLISIFRQQ
jgi:uncharacterized YccA/Bax inhibitor family protein